MVADSVNLFLRHWHRGRESPRPHPCLGKGICRCPAPPPHALPSPLAVLAGVPAKGKAAGLVMPQANTEAMQAHLAEISAAVGPGAHAVLILDQAGWHMSARLAIPENITLLPLPPRSPELNPVENIWQYMRENWLSNRVFADYEDIADHCCEAWNTLRAQPARITSIGLRAWAHRF